MEPRARDPWALAWIAVATIAVAAAVPVLAPFFTRAPWGRTWDDAYMFVRYADNLPACGAIVWNRCEGTTFGLTSLAHFAVVAALRAVLRGEPSVPLTVASAGAGAALLVLVARRVARARREARPVVALYATVALAWAATHVSWHLQSGMDTALAMLWAFAWTSAATRVLARAGDDLAPTRDLARGAGALGVFGALAWCIRPELVVLSACVIGAAAFDRRRAALRAGLSFAVALATILLACRGYFGSFLPLPFHAKSVGSYAHRDPIPMSYEAKVFFRGNALVVSAALLRVVQRRRAGVALGVIVASAALGAFFVLRVQPIMAFEQRFFMPLLPALLVTALDAVEESAPRLRRARAPFVVAVVAVAALVGPAVVILRSGDTFARMLARPGLARFSMRELYDDKAWQLWPALPALVEVPDLVIATTEVGLAGVYLPRARIVDLAGLQDARFARARLDVDALLSDRPDLVYLPHPNYVAMNRDLLAHAAFTTHYEIHPHDVRRMGFAIRKDGPHTARLRAAFAGW